MRTSYKQINSIQHPAMGARMVFENRTHESGPSGQLRDQVELTVIQAQSFLEPSLAPVPIANASAGLENTSLPKYLPPELLIAACC